jgi:uncharacterized membrane protein YsdA (DUF1294 family)
MRRFPSYSYSASASASIRRSFPLPPSSRLYAFATQLRPFCPFVLSAIPSFLIRHLPPTQSSLLLSCFFKETGSIEYVCQMPHASTVTSVRYFVLIGLLGLPVFALLRLGADYFWIGAYAVVLSGLAYWAYAVDKRRAEEGLWRIAEARLHLLELLGGWPGAFLAQRRLRHKCSKGSYQVVFWLIVLAYQFAAYDSFHQWKYTQAALNHFERSSRTRP